MQIIEVQFTPWDQSYYFKPETHEGQPLDLQKNDQVVVETILGTDLGKVVGSGELNKPLDDSREIKPVVRKATPEDQLKFLEINKDKEKLLKDCHELIKKYQLPMKLIDVHQSFDEMRLTFAFIADSRVDFRELLKDLIRRHKKSIRLQQLGVRDEAKVDGDLGPCGRQLCCKSHLKELGNVSTEMAKNQQVAHRGSDRLSGCCGRLKCCLRFEDPVYNELSKNFPEIGSKFKTKQGSGVVVDWHTLKGTVGVNLGTESEPNVVEIVVR